MYIYIITFIFTIGFTYEADTKFKNGNKKKGILYSVIAIFIPTCLAACRDESIGTDVSTYVTYLYKFALNNEIISVLSNSDLEFLFKLNGAIITTIFRNFNILLFSIQLWIILPTYCALYENREKCPMWIGMMVFLLLFYNRSLNLMRQNIAMAIVFWGSRYIFKKKFVKYALTVYIASLFHSSAILAIVMYFIYFFCESKKGYFYMFITYVVLIAVLLNYNNILLFGVNLNILPEKYVERYSITSGEIDFQVIDTVFKLIVLIVILLQNKVLKKYDTNSKFMINMLIMDVILMQVGNWSAYAYRISLYFSMYTILMIPMIVKSSKKNKQIFLIGFITLCFMYWYYIYVHAGSHATVPYKFNIV